jgi:hypothetical protein
VREASVAVPGLYGGVEAGEDRRQPTGRVLAYDPVGTELGHQVIAATVDSC